MTKLKKKKVSIIGLGFVGLPTFLIMSNLKKNNKFLYNVSSIEKNNDYGKSIKKRFESKTNWIKTSDKNF